MEGDRAVEQLPGRSCPPSVPIPNPPVPGDPALAVGLTWVTCKGPSQPKLFWHSVIREHQTCLQDLLGLNSHQQRIHKMQLYPFPSADHKAKIRGNAIQQTQSRAERAWESTQPQAMELPLPDLCWMASPVSSGQQAVMVTPVSLGQCRWLQLPAGKPGHEGFPQEPSQGSGWVLHSPI